VAAFATLAALPTLAALAALVVAIGDTDVDISHA
jgi:hypothetical protein